MPTQPQPSMDTATLVAMWSAISSIIAVLATQGVKALIVWLKDRKEITGKSMALGGRMALSDREQLNRFIDDLRSDQQKTEARLDETLKHVEILQVENASIRAELAVAKTDLTHSMQRSERDNARWNKERELMQSEIQKLKEQIAVLQKRGRA